MKPPPTHENLGSFEARGWTAGSEPFPGFHLTQRPPPAHVRSGDRPMRLPSTPSRPWGLPAKKAPSTLPLRCKTHYPSRLRENVCARYVCICILLQETLLSRSLATVRSHNAPRGTCMAGTPWIASGSRHPLKPPPPPPPVSLFDKEVYCFSLLSLPAHRIPPTHAI